MTSKSSVGFLVRLPDGRTGRVVRVERGQATVEMPSGAMHLLPVHKLKAVK